jgi:hypothetical protein
MPATFGICRLDKDAPIPEWAHIGFSSITRTPDELSIVCKEEIVPERVICERGWHCLQVMGPLDFALTGILASLAAPLAEAGISIFAISTYDTDYFLVKELNRAIAVLSDAGHNVRSET